MAAPSGRRPVSFQITRRPAQQPQQRRALRDYEEDPPEVPRIAPGAAARARAGVAAMRRPTRILRAWYEDPEDDEPVLADPAVYMPRNLLTDGFANDPMMQMMGGIAPVADGGYNQVQPFEEAIDPEVLQAVSMRNPLPIQLEGGRPLPMEVAAVPQEEVFRGVNVGNVEIRTTNPHGNILNLGALLYESYRLAYQEITRRFYLRRPGATDDALGEIFALTGIAAQNVDLGAQPAEDQRRVRRLAQVGSTVRVSIDGLPLELNGEFVDMTIQSFNVLIDVSDLMTARRLFTSMVMQYFSRSADYQGVRSVGYRTANLGSGPRNLSMTDQEANIRLTYSFHFTNPPQIGALLGATRAQDENLFDFDFGQATNDLGDLLRGGTAGRVRQPANTRNVVGGDYTRIRTQTFVKRNTGDFYVNTPCCIRVPYTEENLCFPMAFMRSQCRKLDLDREGNVVGIEENHMIKVPVESDFKKTSFYDGETFTVFETSRRKKRNANGETVYVDEAEIDPDELETWKHAAVYLHMGVCQVCEEDIDPRDLAKCMEAYAFAFGVHISIFSTCLQGKKVEYVAPKRISEDPPDCDLFVNMLMDGHHLNAICKIREYAKASWDVNTSLHHYCDYCHKVNRKWSRQGYPHQNKCRTQSFGAKVSVQSIEYANVVRGMEIDRCVEAVYYKKNDKNMDDVCMNCYGFATFSPKCVCSNPNRIRSLISVCKQCKQPCAPAYINYHNCYMKASQPKEPLNESKLFVYDIESMQTLHEESGNHIHKCILVHMEEVYGENEWVFDTIEEFVDFLISSERMVGSVILAHNGGGYDHHFVVQCLERRGMAHRTTPRPNSLHKYLKLEIETANAKEPIVMLDFLMFFTQSLKSIAEGFKLPISKGDFPHRFSKEEHLHYCGRLPPMDTDDDWYSLKTIRSERELRETKEFWESQMLVYCTCDGLCTCSKRKWDFQTELRAYCKVDVKVLKEAVRIYRNRTMEFSGGSEYDWAAHGVDPYKYMTQSMVSLALFLQGKQIDKLAVSFEKLEDGPFFPAEIDWLEHVQREKFVRIRHAGNSRRKWYDMHTNTYCSGYCEETNTAYVYLDCEYYGCSICHAREIAADDMHPTHKATWSVVSKAANAWIGKLYMNRYYNKVEVHFSHSNQEGWGAGELCKLMHCRDCFYGGRTEVFGCFADVEKMENTEILHHDVCSLYPYVCSWKELPTGLHEVYFGEEIDKARLYPDHPDKYFGFARIKVRPCKTDFIGILPQRTMVNGAEKLTYDLYDKVGCWHTEFIQLAIECGYEILEVYEVWHWPPDQRSDTLMRGYMEFFLRMKQESEGMLFKTSCTCTSILASGIPFTFAPHFAFTHSVHGLAYRVFLVFSFGTHICVCRLVQAGEEFESTEGLGESDGGRQGGSV